MFLVFIFIFGKNNYIVEIDITCLANKASQNLIHYSLEITGATLQTLSYSCEVKRTYVRAKSRVLFGIFMQRKLKIAIYHIKGAKYFCASQPIQDITNVWISLLSFLVTKFTLR